MASAIFICHIDLTASQSAMQPVLIKFHRWLRMQSCVLPHPLPTLLSHFPSVCTFLRFPLCGTCTHISPTLPSLLLCHLFSPISFFPPMFILCYLSNIFVMTVGQIPWSTQLEAFLKRRFCVFIHCNHSSILQIYTFTYQIKQCFSNSGAPLFRVAKGIPRSKQGTENRLILPEKRGSRTKLI